MFILYCNYCVVVVVVVSHIQRIGCQPEKTTLHGGQSRSWSAEQGSVLTRLKETVMPYYSAFKFYFPRENIYNLVRARGETYTARFFPPRMEQEIRREDIL